MFRRRNEDRDSTDAHDDASPGPEAARNAPPTATPGSGEVFTIIYRGTEVLGDIEATGRVRVYGTVRGDLRVNGTLEVAEGGTVEGDLVEVDVVKILGRVQANVVAREKVELWEGGHLEGDVRAAALDIEEGASFTGRSQMLADGGASSSTESSTDERDTDADDDGRTPQSMAGTGAATIGRSGRRRVASASDGDDAREDPDANDTVAAATAAPATSTS